MRAIGGASGGRVLERFEVKIAGLAVDDAGLITGLAAVFDTADRGGDIVRKGAFASARAPMPMLASHDPADVIGVWDELTEVAAGLQVKGRMLVADVQRAAEVRALVQAGAMRGLSIGYVATKKAARAGGGRDLLAVELMEISVVAMPMHPDAKITSVKAQAGGKVDDMTLEEMQAKIADVETKAAAAVVEVEKKSLDLVAAAVAPFVARLADLEAKGNRPDVKAGEVITPERKAFRLYLQRGNLAPEVELKTLTANNDAQGGYLAPPEYAAEVLRDIVEMNPIRALASVKGTNSASVIYPTRKPMGNATWDDIAEDTAETSSADIFGQLEVHTHGMSTFVDIHNLLLSDAPAVETEVREAITEDFALKETRSWALGTGINQPEGLLINTDIATYKNGHATILQADNLVKFLYSIAQTYRGRGAWAMNGTTLGLLRIMKDGQGNWLWQPSLQAGQPETILGRPVVEVLDMPDVASGTTPIIYGDFSGYRILDRASLTTLVDPYTRAIKKETRFHFGRRVGGRVIMAAKFKKYLMAV